MEELINLISHTGFPIAVCVYLLYERDRAMKQLTVAIAELSIIVKERL